MGNIYDFMAIWKSWYRGSVNDFHYFTIKLANGQEKNCERLTMNMPKKVCEDFAKLLWSEKVQITLDKKKNTERLWKILNSNENDFMTNFPDFLERAVFGLGTGVTVEYLKDNKTTIDYIDGDAVMPYKYTNSYINGLITVSRFKRGTVQKPIYFTHITYHEFYPTENRYTRLNELYKSSGEDALGEEIPLKEEFPNLEEFEEFTTDNPHFQVWKPLIANNLDTGSPMGISILANHIDKFKAIDTKYDSFNREFKTGKKRVLVDRSAVKKEFDSETLGFVSYFDTNDEVYVAMGGMDNQPVKEIDFSLRYQEHINSINSELNYLSAGVGLGQNYYEFNGQGVKTATEVISENSDTYRTKVHHQIMINKCLTGLVKAICELENIPFKTINIAFDDSIIEDENALIDRGIKLYTNKVISLEEFMRKYLHYDDAKVKEELEKIQNENRVIKPEGIDFFGNGEEKQIDETQNK